MSSSEYNFQKLTPVNDVDLNVYENALDYTFNNPDVKNIAISGAYSAGKSSVIETYEKKNNRLKFLHISLAWFEEASDAKSSTTNISKNNSEKSDYTDENVLEGKILNQLIHQIDPSKIPQTNFRVKQAISGKNLFFMVIGIILLILLLCYSIWFNNWKYYIQSIPEDCIKNFLLWTTNPTCLLFTNLIAIFIISVFLYKTIRMQINRNLLKRFSVQGNEIEIFEQSDDSYFDKYLNEVLYLFENSGADAIVFEDMDRYNINKIFQRLREVNTLVNNRRNKQGKSPIRFFYLLRDDSFVSKDRTKFFDFIIPIVPVIDSSNSYDQFINHFKLGNILNLFDQHFLQGISLYVDDMRLLKNIYNEFIIYNKRINSTEQNANKLLALIVYKNLFPRDFSDLQLNKGFVFSLFAGKEKFIKNKESEIKNEIEKSNVKIQEIESEILKSASEIDVVYSKSPYAGYYGETKPQFVNEREKRKENICLKENGEIEKIKLRIADLEKECGELISKKLSEIIDRENIDEIFKLEFTNEIGIIYDFHEIKGSNYFDLLKYLIRNGFIDETYPDYLTYFYEKSLSRVDKVFLRSVADQKAKEYTYALKNPELVISRLRDVDFKSEETLNFDLLVYLLLHKEKYKIQVSNLMEQIKRDKRYDFVIEFIETERETPTFVNIINREWTHYFRNIMKESNYSDVQKKLVALLILYHSSSCLLEINSDKSLSYYIENCSDFLQIRDPQIDIIIRGLEELNVKFINIDYIASNINLWNAIYSHNLYELNWQMIENILENQYGIIKSQDYYNKNLSLILSSPEEFLVAYIKENIDLYFEILFENCKSKFLDNEETVKFVLNNESLSDNYKQRYINSLSTQISSLDGINNTVWWTLLLSNELLQYSEKNIIKYFLGEEECYDESLIKYVNKYAQSFLLEGNPMDYFEKESEISTFFNATVRCNELHNDSYKSILKSLRRVYNSFSVEGIDEDKIIILIDLKIIRMSATVLDFVREHYPNQVVYFIVHNIKNYVEDIVDEDNLVLEEVIELLNSKISSQYKISLIKLTEEPISIRKTYEDDVKAYILQHNFNDKDLSSILKEYSALSSECKTITVHLATEYFEDIIENKYSVTYELLQILLSKDSIDYDDRLELLSFSIDTLSESQCISCFEILCANSYLSILAGKRPRFELSEANRRILTNLINRKWITKFETNEGYYRAISRKKHNK